MPLPRELTDGLRARYHALNGHHPMTAADDAYVDELFVPLSSPPAGIDSEELARHMLAGSLPFASYLRSDGELMLAPNLLGLAHAAGGIEALPDWFGAQLAGHPAVISEWEAYMSGGYFVCLRDPAPATMLRKERLMAGIDTLLDRPRPDDRGWRDALGAHVDELDAIEMPFTAYDRLRFGGPVSRDTHITRPREAFALPLAAAS